MRIPDAVHRARAWKVHALARDFALWDAWRYPVQADPARGEDFEAFCRLHDEVLGAAAQGGGAAGFLFRLRRLLGRAFGWDDDVNTLAVPGCAETSVRERLDAGERASASVGEFREVYRTADERLYELSNRTVHALVHLGWVELGGGRRGAELAVYVKPRGRGGRVYLALIEPFRRLVVYPALLRAVGRRWDERGARA